jgi:hypothetical protein
MGNIRPRCGINNLEALKDYHCLVPDLPEHGISIEMKPSTMEGSAKTI